MPFEAKPSLLNECDMDGETPLFVMVEADQFDNFKCLLKEGADTDITTHQDETPLQHAAESEHRLSFYEVFGG